jgi:hypothetical protein
MLTGRKNRPHVPFSRIVSTYRTANAHPHPSLRKTVLECYFTAPSVQFFENYIISLKFASPCIIIQFK